MVKRALHGAAQAIFLPRRGLVGSVFVSDPIGTARLVRETDNLLRTQNLTECVTGDAVRLFATSRVEASVQR